MNTTTPTYQWRFVCKDNQRDERGNHYGHSFWRDLNTDRVSICDMSGERPDLTDDGVLWIDTKRPWVLTSTSLNSLMVEVPVHDKNEEPRFCCMTAHDGVRIGQKLGARIDIDPNSEIGQLLPLIRSFPVQ